jgi:dihydrofolate reductase
MRRLRYCLAVSLDGFIAGPNGEYDWIVPDPEMDFAAHWAQFDTVLMGRRTYEIAKTRRGAFSGSVPRWVVVSRTLKPEAGSDVDVISDNVAEQVAALKAQPGPPEKDIWLFGGGVLFRSLLDAGLVDTVELSVMPVMLGGGVPLLPEGERQALHLDESKALASGILMLKYSVAPRP